MKVRRLSSKAVAAAHRILEDAGVRGPRDIDVVRIAQRHGAVVLYGPTTTMRASIVRTRRHAIIWVDETAQGQPSALFPAAHELGHHALHDLVDHFAQCEGDSAERTHDDRRVEREANDFATELL